MVFRKVLKVSTVINTPNEFDEFVNTSSSISYLYLPNDSLVKRFGLTKLPGHIAPMISLSKKVLSEGRVAIVHGLQEMDSR